MEESLCTLYVMSEPKSTKRPVEVIKMTHHHCCQYPWVEMCMGGVLGDISHSAVCCQQSFAKSGTAATAHLENSSPYIPID